MTDGEVSRTRIDAAAARRREAVAEVAVGERETIDRERGIAKALDDLLRSPPSMASLSAPGPWIVSVFSNATIAPLLSVIVLHSSWVRSIVSPSAAPPTASRRLPAPLSLQFWTTTGGGPLGCSDCCVGIVPPARTRTWPSASEHATARQAASGNRRHRTPSTMMLIDPHRQRSDADSLASAWDRSQEVLSDFPTNRRARADSCLTRLLFCVDKLALDAIKNVAGRVQFGVIASRCFSRCAADESLSRQSRQRICGPPVVLH